MHLVSKQIASKKKRKTENHLKSLLVAVLNIQHDIATLVSDSEVIRGN